MILSITVFVQYNIWFHICIEINKIQFRSVPALPSGMEKEEEGEKHLQDILAVGLVDTGIVIPTPECSEIQTNPLSASAPGAETHKQSSEKSDGAVSNHYDRVRATMPF